MRTKLDSNNKLLVEQILDEMFKNISEKEEFNNEIIVALKKLSSSGSLRKASQVEQILKIKSGEI